jgi:hypothetical protein
MVGTVVAAALAALAPSATSSPQLMNLVLSFILHIVI